MTPPPRGFPAEEFAARTRRAQALMAERGLAALLLTTEPEVRYYTGFLTRFWESPTRPWFVIVPAKGDPIAVIPEIGAHLMRQSWVTNIRTWPSPDYTDDGIGLLAETLAAVVPEGAAIGLAEGRESYLRLPLDQMENLRSRLGTRSWIGDGGLTGGLRQVKSQAEIAKIARAAEIADRAFDRVGEIARPGAPLEAVFRGFQGLCLEEGADWVPYLAGAAEPVGYRDVISPATERLLALGDVLMLDVGLVWDGYFCDFDRNFSLGPPQEETRAGHARAIAATQAGFVAAKPGARASDVFAAMKAILGGGATGRLGHGVGQQLTEGLSLIPDDHTVLAPGMVITLEPVVPLSEGRILVHEEMVEIRATGPAYVSRPQAADIRVL